MQAMEISRTALDVEWRRLEVIAENLANANVAGTATGAIYQARQLVSGPKTDFAALLDGKSPTGAGIDINSLAGVAIQAVQASAEPPRLVREPGNPAANAEGLVAYPAIDHAAEMTRMVATARAYEANIVALNTAREMYSKALQLGERA